MLRSVGWGTFLFATTCFSLFANAVEESGRRGQLGKPIMVLHSDAPYATTRVLLFRDGRLYAAGDDQVVRSWVIKDEAVDESSVRTYRWPVWHEQRGAIKALAISPDGERLAIGGYGVMTPLVCEVAIESGEIVRSSADVGSTILNEVRGLAYGKDGTLYAGTHTGGIGCFLPFPSQKWVNLRADDVKVAAASFGVVAMTPDGNNCRALLRNGSVISCDANGGVRKIAQVPTTEGCSFFNATFSSDGKLLAALESSESLLAKAIVFSLASNTPVRSIDLSAGDVTPNSGRLTWQLIELDPSGDSVYLSGQVISLADRPIRRAGILKRIELGDGQAEKPLNIPSFATAVHCLSEQQLVLTPSSSKKPVVASSLARLSEQLEVGLTDGPGIYSVGFPTRTTDAVLWQTKEKIRGRRLDSIGEGSVTMFDPTNRDMQFNFGEAIRPCPVSQGGWSIQLPSQGAVDTHFFFRIHRVESVALISTSVLMGLTARFVFLVHQTVSHSV